MTVSLFTGESPVVLLGGLGAVLHSISPRLEMMVGAFGVQQPDLAAHLEARMGTGEETDSLRDSATEGAKALEAADHSF